MAHANARLTEFGRLLLVQRITELGWPPAQAAESLGVSRATAYKWLARYRVHGQAGLADRSSRPHRCPHALTPDQVRRVLAARRRHRQGPHRLAWRLHMPRSTIYGVLRRHGVNRLAHTDRASGVVLPARAPRRAGPHRRQEAGPHPRGWWPPHPRPGPGATRTRDRLRLPPLGRR